MLKIITATQTVFFLNSQQYLFFFNLIVCCKTSEGGADLEGPLFSNYSILSKFA